VRISEKNILNATTRSSLLQKYQTAR